jgi:hypothetical protein
MGVLADRLDSMRVRATARGGWITAELHHRTEIRLTFGAGSYRRYSEQLLEQDLTSLARALWAGRMKAYYQAVSEAFEEPVSGERRPVTPRDVEYRNARDDLVARGESADGRIVISVRGMRNWVVRIAPGTLRTLTEDEFAEATGAAGEALVRDQFARIRALKNRIYG